MSAWNRLQPGDVVRLKSKRTAGEPFEVTVDEVLEPVRADGRGFRGTDGVTYRFYYYDIVLTKPVAAPDVDTDESQNPATRATGI